MVLLENLVLMIITVFFSFIMMLNTYYVNKQLPLKIDLTKEDMDGGGTAAESDADNENVGLYEDLKKRRKRIDMQLYMD